MKIIILLCLFCCRSIAAFHPISPPPVTKSNTLSTQLGYIVSTTKYPTTVQPSTTKSDQSFYYRGTSLNAAVALPSISTVALSSFLPSSLGYAKIELGVGHGYGTAVGLIAYLILRQLEQGSVAYWHAMALIFYGVRLNLFLLYRELKIPRFRQIQERIEARQGSKKRIVRTPFVVGCAVLYAFLAAPLWITSQASCNHPLVQIFVGISWIGFILAALGDLQKSYVKAILGLDTLVKGGLFKYIRHPNYVGEEIGWTASFAASLVVAVTEWNPSFIIPLVASALGWFGIFGILAGATAGLEKKQRRLYGETSGSDYFTWVSKSWAGPMPKRKK